MIRALAFLVLCALAIAACERYIDLSPPPDAHRNDTAFIGDSPPPDAFIDHDAKDAGSIPPDGAPLD